MERKRRELSDRVLEGTGTDPATTDLGRGGCETREENRASFGPTRDGAVEDPRLIERRRRVRPPPRGRRSGSSPTTVGDDRLATAAMQYEDDPSSSDKGGENRWFGHAEGEPFEEAAFASQRATVRSDRDALRLSRAQESKSAREEVRSARDRGFAPSETDGRGGRRADAASGGSTPARRRRLQAIEMPGARFRARST